MSFEQPKKEVIKTPEIKIKEGVDFVFEQNPELVNTAYETLGFVDFSVPEKSGYVTLYRAEGETVDREELLPFQKGNAGTWFSPDQKELLRYVEMAKDRKAYKIDIPKSLYDSLNSIAKSNIEMSKGEVQLPIELADKKEILTSENENVINKNYFKSWIISNRIKSGGITEIQKQEAEGVYSKYLETIFPDSKVKDIVYHGTSSKFEEEKFDKSKLGTSTSNITNKLGFYFVPERLVANIFIKGRKFKWKDGKIEVNNPTNAKVYSTILNISNPETIEGDIFQKAAEENTLPPLRLDGDSLIITPQTKNILPEFSVTNYVVFEPEQIHILGSKKDIEDFKEFVFKSE